MSEDELKALAADIDPAGQRQPISLYESDILDGRNRYLAITRYCAPGRVPKYEAVDPDSPIAFVISLNEKRRHMNDSQRAMAAAKALPFFEREAKLRQGRPGQPRSGQLAGTKGESREQAGTAFGTSGRTV